MNCSLSSIANNVQTRAPVWNSAFKVIEAPMSYANKLLNTHGKWPELIFFSPVTGREFSVAFDQFWYGLKKFNCTQIKSGSTDFKGKLGLLGDHLYDKKIIILATAIQIVAFPISWIFTPITAIADIFAGVIQATIRTSQGASKEEIQSILHKKVIAAPVQQLSYTINNLVVLGPIFLQAAKVAAVAAPILCVFVVGSSLLAGLSLTQSFTLALTIPKIYASLILSIAKDNVIKGVLLHSLLIGDLLYRNAQSMVGKLPKFFIPDGYNIFIESGALDEFGNNAFNSEEKYAEFKAQSEGFRSQSNQGQANERPYSSNYKASIKNDLDKIQQKDPSFKELRDWFESNKEPYTLFGFESQEKVNESSLKKSYHKLALKYHPDKCAKQSIPEATILFKMISTVREDIEKNILKLNL